MVQFLEELQGVSTDGLTPAELVELEQLRVKYEKLKQKNAGSAQAALVRSQLAHSAPTA